MRNSRKKPLRLDQKTHYCDELNAFEQEEEHDYRSYERRKPRYKQSEDHFFQCKHCRRFVCPPTSGGKHRNHCPFCLFSRHVDDRKSGDRLSLCGSKMEPVGNFQRPNGEYVIIHQCLGCGFERFNRIAADDDFELVLSLPTQTPRNSRDIKAEYLKVELDLGEEFEDFGVA